MRTEVDRSIMNDAHKFMTPKTCKAARALLGMGQLELAERAGIALQTVRNFENEESQPTHPTWLKIKHVLEKAGVRFLEENGSEGAGVRYKRPGGAK